MLLEVLPQELVQKLPSPRGVALAIIEACQREDLTTTELAKLVQTDPALSGRLLMRANSAATGGHPIASVAEAVFRLGMTTVRQLALSFSLVDQHSAGCCKEFDYTGFWSHSLMMALALQEIGRIEQIGSTDELFTCGLLSQVGRLALATAYPQQYGSVIAPNFSSAQQLQLEQKNLHVNHMQITIALMTQWGIPHSLVGPVSFHEVPALSGYSFGSRALKICDALHLALKIADYAMASGNRQASLRSELSALARASLLDAKAFLNLVSSVIVLWKDWGKILKIQTPNISGFDAVAPEISPPLRNNQEPVLFIPSSTSLRVLVVEDDPSARRLMEVLIVQQKNCLVRVACNGQEALECALEFMPHVVVTDWRMPVMDGIDLCRALRSSEWGQKMYILMVTGVGEEDALVTAFDAGVDNYLVRPVNARALSARLKGARRFVQMREDWESDHAQLMQMTAELALSNKRFYQASLTDPLTELSNRRAGLQALEQAWSGSSRRSTPFSLISLDIDHFKRINDSHGHAAGDVVLQHTAKTLRQLFRGEDTICRWGGEEFLVISPNLGYDGAARAAERLRLAIAQSQIDIHGESIAVTVSLGVACWEQGLQSVELLLSNADAALYEAKSSGRNKVVLYQAPPQC